jgi:hypothetical protein
MNDLENPYASPRDVTLPNSFESLGWFEGVQIGHVERKARKLRVQFLAPLHLELEYRASIFLPDSVLLNGRLVAQQDSLNSLFVNEVSFPYCCGGQSVPIKTEARWHYLLPIIQEFRIQIAGLTVFQDDYWRPPQKPK